MNRGTVILLALAILVAHTFAIHQTPDGDLGSTYEISYVAFRLGRNLVHEGAALWNPGGPFIESYPSVLWVLLCGLAERLYVSPLLVTQTVGVCSALASVIVLAQFSPKRSTGLIAPLLVAASGSAAAASLSGTEAPLAMFLVTTVFLAFERGWGRTLSAALALLVLTRPEGFAILLATLVFEWSWRPSGLHGRRPPRWRAYRIPILVACTATLARRALTGQWLSPFGGALLAIDLERWRLGAEYLASFTISSGFGLLFLVAIASLLAARSSVAGTRALVLAAVWWGLVVLTGGDELPFWNALVPVLPLFFLGVQESLREWMDERESLSVVVWPLLLVTLGASFLVSKIPSDLGPLKLERPLVRWQTPSAGLAAAYPRALGRLGLLVEIRTVEHLRTLGVFLRDRVGADAVILTSWPGAIGYLCRKEVLDLTGRAWPPPGHQRPLSWRGFSRVDVVGSLSSSIDYIVPQAWMLGENEAPNDFLGNWLERYDTVGPTRHRVREMLAALGDFTLISVPVPAQSRNPREPSDHPFPLLQRKDLEKPPRLELHVSGGQVRVTAQHEGHLQVVDLSVRLVRPDGEELCLTPTGSWKPDQTDARTSVLVFPTGPRVIQLIEAPLPADSQGSTLSAWLHNPGMGPVVPLSTIGVPVTREL